jgi:hypothetical protein
MNVVPLTLTVSLCLVLTFIIFFLREHARGALSSAERDSLLPLADETSRIAVKARHSDTGNRCVCHDGSRPPCAGCAKTNDRS